MLWGLHQLTSLLQPTERITALETSDDSQALRSFPEYSFKRGYENPPEHIAEIERGLLVIKCNSDGPLPGNTLETSMPWTHTECSFREKPGSTMFNC